MMMKIETISAKTLTSGDRERLADIAALGFSRMNDAKNSNDTAAHCLLAEHVQTASISGNLVGFALYRRQLWR